MIRIHKFHGVVVLSSHRIITQILNSLCNSEAQELSLWQQSSEEFWCLNTIVLIVFVEYNEQISWITQKLRQR